MKSVDKTNIEIDSFKKIVSYFKETTVKTLYDDIEHFVLNPDPVGQRPPTNPNLDNEQMNKNNNCPNFRKRLFAPKIDKKYCQHCKNWHHTVVY